MDPVISLANAAAPSTQSVTFSVLLICTANHCRSPMAEYLLRQRSNALGLEWRVRSAGTRAYVGLPMHTFAAQALAAAAVDPEDFRGQQCSPELLQTSDLVLTMTRAQRDWVVATHPRSLRRTFVLPHFVHLVSAGAGSGAARDGSDLLERAQRARSRVQPLTSGQEVADPLGHGLTRFVACRQRLERLIDGLLPVQNDSERVALR